MEVLKGDSGSLDEPPDEDIPHRAWTGQAALVSGFTFWFLVVNMLRTIQEL